MNIIFHSNLSFVNNNYYGKEVFVNYLNHLSNCHKINFITSIINEETAYNTERINHNTFKISPLPKNILKRLFFLWKNIKQDNISLIFMPTYTGVAAAIISIILKKKYVIYHGADWAKHTTVLLKDKKGLNKILFKYQPYINNKIDFYICSKSDAILVTGGQLKEKFSNIGIQVIETKPIINLDLTKEKLPEKVVDNFFNVLYVGNLSKGKGIYDLIEAFRLIEKGLGIRLKIVGIGVEKEELMKLVDNNSLKGIVAFRGFIKNGPELFKEYINADVFLLPSYAEGFPRVLYEAMFFNTAIITTSVNSIPYLLEHEKTALFIETNNPTDIKSKILRLYSDNELKEKIAGNGKNLVDSILIEPAWKQHSKIIKHLLE